MNIKLIYHSSQNFAHDAELRKLLITRGFDLISIESNFRKSFFFQNSLAHCLLVDVDREFYDKFFSTLKYLLELGISVDIHYTDINACPERIWQYSYVNMYEIEQTKFTSGTDIVADIINLVAGNFFRENWHQIGRSYDEVSQLLSPLTFIEPLSKFSSSLEFSPEHKHAGLQILNYFQETLNQKYPDNDVTVRISQNGNTVTMEIETPDGETKLYEKALVDYGLVVTGQKSVEEYLENPLDIAALEYKLEIAYAELKMNTKLLAAKDQVIENQKDQLARQDQAVEFFKSELSLATRATRFSLKEFAAVAKKSQDKNDPVELFKWMDWILSESGPEALKTEIESTKDEDPDLYHSIMNRANTVVDGAVTKALSTGLVEFLQSLVKNI